MKTIGQKVAFTYARGARVAEIKELYRDISPLETAHMTPEFAKGPLLGALLFAAAHSRTYAVRLDGRLAGICFIEDRDFGRLMSFTKTRYLTEERKVAFARGIPQLLKDLARAEKATGRDDKPMYMHVPDGDRKSEAWFVRSGCRRTAHGLMCPRTRGAKFTDAVKKEARGKVAPLRFGKIGKGGV